MLLNGDRSVRRLGYKARSQWVYIQVLGLELDPIANRVLKWVLNLDPIPYRNENKVPNLVISGLETLGNWRIRFLFATLS